MQDICNHIYSHILTYFWTGKICKFILPLIQSLEYFELKFVIGNKHNMVILFLISILLALYFVCHCFPNRWRTSHVYL